MTLTDAFLIVSPIVILRASRLESGLRLRLTAAVSISVVATIFVVIHVALTMSIGGLWAAIFGVVEVRIPSSLSHWSDHHLFAGVCCDIRLQHLCCPPSSHYGREG